MTASSMKNSYEGNQVLPHSVYFPDLEPTDYHVSKSLPQDCAESALCMFVVSRDTQFFENGIERLVNLWLA